ncbi:Uncharacterised protein [Legionella wadsworthii]|uniref:Uncharacterized protein n=1 Tax=Legionella wadsworthii TaxID=28088 RepID=A0A378LTN1_9GAMM|nr:hypothetical protein [Legionella wadsworthii]STY30668.1 Uncharacterised protein [Legionella wadsworthii]
MSQYSKMLGKLAGPNHSKVSQDQEEMVEDFAVPQLSPKASFSPKSSENLGMENVLKNILGPKRNSPELKK